MAMRPEPSPEAKGDPEGQRVPTAIPVAHSPLAPAWFALTIAVTAGLTIYGVATLGWRAISWSHAVVSGAIGAFAFLLVAVPLGLAAGDLDFLDLLGSTFARPGSVASRVVGALVHHADGALLGIAWAYGVAIFRYEPGWDTGFIGGLVLWGLALALLNTIGAVHPAIRRGERRDPSNTVPSLAILIPHAVYGIVLGGLYRWWSS